VGSREWQKDPFFGKIHGLKLSLWLSSSGNYIASAMRKRKSIAEVWDNESLKLSFRRTFYDQMM
jgi:hypothetical protein